MNCYVASIVIGLLYCYLASTIHSCVRNHLPLGFQHKGKQDSKQIWLVNVCSHVGG